MSRVSPGSSRCHRPRRDVGLLEDCSEDMAGCMVEHVQVGESPSAHLVACSLWLQRLSMTEGYLVKTTLVDGD